MIHGLVDSWKNLYFLSGCWANPSHFLKIKRERSETGDEINGGQLYKCTCSYYMYLHDRPRYGAIGTMISEGCPLLQVEILRSSHHMSTNQFKDDICINLYQCLIHKFSCTSSQLTIFLNLFLLLQTQENGCLKSLGPLMSSVFVFFFC